MTTPYDRYRTLRHVPDLLEAIIDPVRTPSVQSHIRDLATSLYEHFPTDEELDVLAEESPEVLSPEPPKRKKWLDSFTFGSKLK